MYIPAQPANVRLLGSDMSKCEMTRRESEVDTSISCLKAGNIKRFFLLGILKKDLVDFFVTGVKWKLLLRGHVITNWDSTKRAPSHCRRSVRRDANFQLCKILSAGSRYHPLQIKSIKSILVLGHRFPCTGAKVWGGPASKLHFGNLSMSAYQISSVHTILPHDCCAQDFAELGIGIQNHSRMFQDHWQIILHEWFSLIVDHSFGSKTHYFVVKPGRCKM